MTPGESEQIALAGAVVLENISNLIFITGLFGAYILAFMIGMHIILLHRRQKENHGWALKAIITLLLVGFVMTALSTCADIASDLLMVKFGFVVPLTGGLNAQEIAADLKSGAMDILQNWSDYCIILMADTAIIWRAWVLWAGNRTIKWTLLIILLADIAVDIANAVADTKVINMTNGNSDNNAVVLDFVNPVLNLTVNIVATFLIAYRAWIYHQSIPLLRNNKTYVEAILLLMVESGAIYGVVQVTSIIFKALNIHAAGFSPIQRAEPFFSTLYVYSAALNPVALVILIQTENTYEHSFHLEDVSSLEINSVPNVS